MIESHIIIDKARYKTCIGFNITEFLADMHIITKSNKFIIKLTEPNINIKTFSINETYIF